MVSLRLTKVGRKNAPAYRIVAVNKHSKRDGGFLEIVGNYNPSENPVKFSYNKERYEYWLKTGAQPSDAVSQLVKGTYKFVPYNKGKATAETGAAEAEIQESASETQNDAPTVAEAAPAE